jgi:hypothetical protein
VLIKKAKFPLSRAHSKLAKEAFGWDLASITFGKGKNLNGNTKSTYLGSSTQD